MLNLVLILEVIVLSVMITDTEAKRLLEMVKHSLENIINFPFTCRTKQFDVVGDTNQDIFTISIYKGKINQLKYNFGARIQKSGIMLLQLHISPSNVHINPDGERILGNHWHIYSENYGGAWAFPAENIESDKFAENTISFLKKFNVVECPEVICQTKFI